MIGFFRIALAVFAIHLFETTLLYRTGPVINRLDLMLLLVAFLSFRRGPLQAAVLGAAIGFFRDLVWANAGGEEALAFGVAAWFASAAHRRVVGESFVGLFLILLGTVLVHDLVRLAGQIPYRLFPFAARVALVTLPAGLVTAVVGVAIAELFRFRRRPHGEAT